jgi:hypothetical protein
MAQTKFIDIRSGYSVSLILSLSFVFRGELRSNNLIDRKAKMLPEKFSPEAFLKIVGASGTAPDGA